jgi:hypothetical protein
MKKIKTTPVIVTVMLIDIENVIPYHPPWLANSLRKMIRRK